MITIDDVMMMMMRRRRKEEEEEKEGGAKKTSTNSYIAPTSTIVSPLFLGTSPLTMVSAFVLIDFIAYYD